MKLGSNLEKTIRQILLAEDADIGSLAEAIGKEPKYYFEGRVLRDCSIVDVDLEKVSFKRAHLDTVRMTKQQFKILSNVKLGVRILNPVFEDVEGLEQSKYSDHENKFERLSLPILSIYLAAPRGFCAGVDRAIKIVEMALDKWGAPVFVRHEIVHNKFVVDHLRAKGAVFVEELDECPDDRPVIVSAHGVPKAVPAAAVARQMIYVDATCPLVSKVHIEAERHAANGLQLIMIGHAGHPETIGTMGQLPDGGVLLVETVEDVATVAVRDPERLAFVTQTTLSIDDTADIVAALKARFPAIVGPHKEDICYATTNRQAAVKAIAREIDALLVIGAPNSSSSRRLVEVGSKAGCDYAQLVSRAEDIDWRALEGAKAVGITASASTPEVLVEEALEAFRERFTVTERVVETAQEYVEFKVPRVLR
jgi:4-hydroxy-3-methylbut-2-en-1-yl diphosphate reductase